MSGFAGYNHVGTRTRLRAFVRETPSLKERMAARLEAERIAHQADYLANHEKVKEQAAARRKAEQEAARPVNRMIAKVKGIFRKVIGR